MAAADASGGLRYRAFLSYSHRDERMASRLHRRLESYRPPRGVVGARHARLAPVFRDREELASAGELSGAIREALAASEALVVIGSPAAVASRWVGEEVAWFRARFPDRPVFAFVVEGDPGVDPRLDPGAAALPLALLLEHPERPQGPLREPLAADAREHADGFGAASLKLIAGLLGVGFDALRRRELRRRRRQLLALSVGSLLLAGVFAVLAWQATVARDAARVAQARAELELQSERQTRGFLLSVFRLADPGESRGADVTVREVLDRAVERIAITEFSRPVVRARYLATMGQAYASIGVNQEAADLLSQALDALPPDDAADEVRAQRLDSRIELADLLFDMGKYDAALDQLAQAAANDAARVSPMQRGHLETVRGDVLAYLERDAEALEAYALAERALDDAATDPSRALALRGRARSGRALVAAFAGDFDHAERLYRDALDDLLTGLGEHHPESVAAMSSWASSAHLAGHRDVAVAANRRALAAALRLYDPGSPSVGSIKANLGRLLLEAGALDEAEPLLRDALASDRRHRAADFDDLAYPLANLAIVRQAQGDPAEARALLEEALPIAESHGHRMHGAILNHLAALDCGDGPAEPGRARAEQALAINRDRHGPDHAYTAQSLLLIEHCGGPRLDGPARRAALDAMAGQWSESSPMLRSARGWR